MHCKHRDIAMHIGLSGTMLGVALGITSPSMRDAHALARPPWCWNLVISGLSGNSLVLRRQERLTCPSNSSQIIELVESEWVFQKHTETHLSNTRPS